MNHTKIIGFILTVPAALATMAEKAAPAAGAQGDSDRLGTAVAINTVSCSTRADSPKPNRGGSSRSTPRPAARPPPGGSASLLSAP